MAFDLDLLAEQYEEENTKQRICIIANMDTIVYAEKLRKSYENCIVDVQLDAANTGNYDKVVEIQFNDGKYEVLEK